VTGGIPVKAPFSRRFGGSKAWVQEDWPSSARTALLHLLYELVDRRCVGGWIAIDKELRRIAREVPKTYDRELVKSSREAQSSAEAILDSLPWQKVFDFCERLHNHLAIAELTWDDLSNDLEEVASRSDVQREIADELQRLFFEENLGYSFVQGEVRRRGRSHTVHLVERVEPTLGDPRLNGAREHYAKARRYFEHPVKPDYENTVKEAVCAVEAAARSLFPAKGTKTLADVVRHIQGSGKGQLPKPLADTLSGLYGFRNAGNGVSHGGSNGGEATPAIAEYALALAASQVVLLHAIAAELETDVPF
jgi:hypothetical protein